MNRILDLQSELQKWATTQNANTLKVLTNLKVCDIIMLEELFLKWCLSSGFDQRGTF